MNITILIGDPFNLQTTTTTTNYNYNYKLQLQLQLQTTNYKLQTILPYLLSSISIYDPPEVVSSQRYRLEYWILLRDTSDMK